MSTPLIDVAVAIVRARDGRLLMAERTARQLGAGFWELPGGKIELGEAPAAAAARELHEETGVVAEALRPAARYVHAYRQRSVRVHAYVVDRWHGEPVGREGQRLAWVDPRSPSVGPVLPALERMLAALGLPDHGVVLRAHGRDELARLRAALRAGLDPALRLLLLRVTGLTTEQRVVVAREARAACDRQGARLVLSGAAHDARLVGHDALHSPAAELARLASRPAAALWLASCHGAGDLQRAMQLGADAVLLSPVQPSPRHPQRAALGWDGLRALMADCPLPVYAQGGLSRDDLPRARAEGAVGVVTSATPRP